MKRDSITIVSFGSLFAAGIFAAGILAAATAQDKKEPAKREAPAEKKETMLVSTEQAKYKEVMPGITQAVLSGDPEKGAYRAFTKFAPGINEPLHTHSNDLALVVLKGTFIYKPEKGDEKRVSAGSYLFIPAGDRHASGADPKEGALFFDESSGKFDMTLIEKK